MQPLWETVWGFLNKTKLELPYDPAIPLLEMYTKKTKTLIQRDTCPTMFITALFTRTKIWKQPKCLSTDEWIKKMDVWMGIYTMEYYSAIKKNEILPFASIWMDLENIMLSDISKTEKDKYSMLSLYLESKK